MLETRRTESKPIVGPAAASAGLALWPRPEPISRPRTTGEAHSEPCLLAPRTGATASVVASVADRGNRFWMFVVLIIIGVAFRRWRTCACVTAGRDDMTRASPGGGRPDTEGKIGTNWGFLAGGSQHTMAVKTDGILWAWGNNGSGQLGDGTTTDHASPVQVGTATDWASVAAGDVHTVAVKTVGTLWPGARTGPGSWATAPPPTAPARSRSASIPTGPRWPLATFTRWRSRPSAPCGLGQQWVRQLGDGTTHQSSSPLQVGLGHRWVTVSAGDSHTMATR